MSISSDALIQSALFHPAAGQTRYRSLPSGARRCEGRGTAQSTYQCYRPGKIYHRGHSFCKHCDPIEKEKRKVAIKLHTRNAWSEEEDKLLTSLWPTLPISEITKRLGRSAPACYDRGRRLNLQKRPYNALIGPTL